MTSFLLFDGRQNEKTFETLNEENGFPRLLELIQIKKDDDAGLHRMLLELLYEMSRMQRLRIDELSERTSIRAKRLVVLTTFEPVSVEDDFIVYMLQIIEGLSDDVNDPYHYPVIRVLVWLQRLSCNCKLIVILAACIERAIHGFGARSWAWPKG